MTVTRTVRGVLSSRGQDPARAYAFARVEGGDDVFVHRSVLRDAAGRSIDRTDISALDGREVDLEGVFDGGRGPRATGARLVGEGSEPAAAGDEEPIEEPIEDWLRGIASDLMGEARKMPHPSAPRDRLIRAASEIDAALAAIESEPAKTGGGV